MCIRDRVLAGGKVVGFVSEFAAAGVFRGGDVGAFFLHRGGYGTTASEINLAGNCFSNTSLFSNG